MERQSARSELLLHGVENIRFDAVTAAQVISWPGERQQRLRRELERLFRNAFSRMSDIELLDWVEDYFRVPAKGFQRHAFLLWNESCRLAAATLFEEGRVQYHGEFWRGIYVIGRAVLPEHQDSGAGQGIAAKILAQFKPDVLMTTCTQSASLYSWIAVAHRSFSEEYEVFPQFKKGILMTFPIQDLGFATSSFRQLYFSVVHGHQDQVDRAVAGLTVLLVRKSMHKERYGFYPWEKAGRNDPLAEALGVGRGDGILLVALRKGLKGS
jgi:hypothetical protein